MVAMPASAFIYSNSAAVRASQTSINCFSASVN
jgi:hypothetical protein